MCAAIAARQGLSVLVIDHNEQPGRKILISGGGRCNFTNVDTVPERFISANPHFARSALARYTPADFIALVEKFGIAWHEKTLGQLFCDGSAKQIVEMLMGECRKGEVAFELGRDVIDVGREGEGFRVTCGASSFEAVRLVVATGGPSIPKLGASDFAYRLARQFGLKIVEPRPALVPFKLPPEEAIFQELAGVSAPVRVGCGKKVFEEAALFTHRGLSGPAILQISSYWQSGETVWIDFLPAIGAAAASGEFFLEAKRAQPNTSVGKLLGEALPNRLAQALVERLDASASLGAMSDKALRAAAHQLRGWTFRPSGTEGYAKAEVTRGGVATSELSSKTMEAKRQPGLYFIGEAVDVTGWLGGYNFQWAWASGHAAGEALAMPISPKPGKAKVP